MYIRINDIRYTNNRKNKSFTDKAGEKYKHRKNKIYECVPLPDAPSKYSLDFIEVDENGQPTGCKIETIPFIKATSNAKGNVCILTENTIYDCTDVTKIIEKKLVKEVLEDQER